MKDLQSKGKNPSDDGGDTVGPVPTGDTEGLLGATVPLSGDDGEEWETAGLEESEEEPSDVDPLIVGRGGHTSSRAAPRKDKEGHELTSGDSDDDVGREGLPGELSDSVDGSSETDRQLKPTRCEAKAHLYWSPVRARSVLRPKTLPRPNTTLSKICKK